MSTTDSNSFTIQVLTSQLQQTIAGLSVGQSSTATLNTDTGFLPDRPGSQEMNWIQTFYYDEVRKIAWGMCQRHQGAGTYSPFHFEYNETTNVWTCEETGGPLLGGASHVFSIPSYDYATGDRFYQADGGRTDRISRWQVGNALDTWADELKNANNDPISVIMQGGSNRFVSGAGAMAWHPNLFGIGDGGCVVMCQEGVGAWRESTDTYSVLVPDNGLIVDGGQEPGFIYSRGLDGVFVCSNDSAGDRTSWIITQGPTVTLIDDTPAKVGPDFDGSGGACIVDDPVTGNNSCYLLQRAGSGQVWKYNAGTLGWDSQIYSHPFEGRIGAEEDFMCAAVYGTSAIWALEKDSSTTNIRSRLWIPG